MTYGLDSGGNPEVIPQLTYKAFKSFHESHYHPSNTRFFFWGDDPEEQRFALLEPCLLYTSLPLQTSPSPSQDFHAYRIPACGLSRCEGRGNPPDVGKSRATKNREWPAFPVSAIAPAEERKGEVNRNMTSWAVFTFGWQVPADAKSGKNGSEMPPHTFSQEVHGGRFGEGASGRLSLIHI